MLVLNSENLRGYRKLKFQVNASNGVKTLTFYKYAKELPIPYKMEAFINVNITVNYSQKEH
jgi:hypothetical protein